MLKYNRPPTIALPLYANQFKSPPPRDSYCTLRLTQSQKIVLAGVSFLLAWTYAIIALSRRRSPSDSSLAGLSEFEGLGAMSGVSHLVIVAGHAVWLGHRGIATAADEQLASESDWILEPYQHGQTTTFKQHIQRGSELAVKDPSALLVFSGGQTRVNAGPRSEAQSYFAVAQDADLLHPDVVQRVTTEEYARDSYENLLFSICRFYEVTGAYPQDITVVGYEFKRERFETVHREAIRFPKSRFHYVGIDPLDAMTEGESSNALHPFQTDPYACHTPQLIEKRRNRNPFRRRHAYDVTNPALRKLLRWCPPHHNEEAVPWFPETLPWSSLPQTALSSSDAHGG